MRIAPAMIPCTANGGVGSRLAAKIVSTPCSRSNSVKLSNFRPARRRTVREGKSRPTQYVLSAAPSTPATMQAPPRYKPKATMARSESSGRGNITNAAGVYAAATMPNAIRPSLAQAGRRCRDAIGHPVCNGYAVVRAERALLQSVGFNSLLKEAAMFPAVRDWSEAMLTALAGGMAMFFAAIPKVIAFAIILVVGWFVAGLIARLAARVLRAVHFNQLAERSGFGGFVRNIGVQNDCAGFLAMVANWFLRLIVLVVAFDALGL